LRIAELAYYQWRNGNLDADLWAGQDAGMYSTLWYQDWMVGMWTAGATATYFAPEFRKYIDKMVANI
jgi:hypothetical protein